MLTHQIWITLQTSATIYSDDRTICGLITLNSSPLLPWFKFVVLRNWNDSSKYCYIGPTFVKRHCRASDCDFSSVIITWRRFYQTLKFLNSDRFWQTYTLLKYSRLLLIISTHQEWLMKETPISYQQEVNFSFTRTGSTGGKDAVDLVSSTEYQ
jgi:hypothetical protein